MNIRKARLSDATTISQIASQTFALACPPNTLEEELQKYIVENLGIGSFSALIEAGKSDIRVLEDAGSVVGFTLVDPTPAPLGIAAADGMRELTRCYVQSDHHGKGAAQKLIQAALDELPSPMRLTVNDQNTRAIRFYARNGFSEVGETRFQCGQDVHRDIVMVRQANT